jgi:hypothetical protein
LSKERKVDPGTPSKSNAAVDSQKGAKPKNTRRFLRLPIATPTVIRYLNGDPATRTYILSSRLPGTLLNIGAGGALVLCENAPQPGELLTLEVRLQDEFEFGGVLGKVKRVEPDEEGGFLVGIEFGVLKTLCPERAAWQLPPGVVRMDDAFREALHHFLFTMEVQRRSQSG